MLARTLPASPIVPNVDFDREGIQHGHLRLPYSRDDSAWGSVMIPIAVVKNGDGPTALLTGGNHGDEYEGPIALLDLFQSRLITMEEALRGASNPDEFRMRVSGICTTNDQAKENIVSMSNQ